MDKQNIKLDWTQTSTTANPLYELTDLGRNEIIFDSNDWTWKITDILGIPDENAGKHLNSWLQKQLEDGNNK